MRVVRGTPRIYEGDRPDTIEGFNQAYDDEVAATRWRRLQKAMALRDEIGLTDDQRHSLAQMIPGVDKDDGGSWKDLNPKQLHDLITMMEGWVFITAMKMQDADWMGLDE